MYLTQLLELKKSDTDSVNPEELVSADFRTSDRHCSACKVCPKRFWSDFEAFLTICDSRCWFYTPSKHKAKNFQLNPFFSVLLLWGSFHFSILFLFFLLLFQPHTIALQSFFRIPGLTGQENMRSARLNKSINTGQISYRQ